MPELVTLTDCPIGLFLCGDTLALKTEYRNNEGRIDAYIVESGEFFWGDQPQTIASQRAQLVTPVDLAQVRIDAAAPAPLADLAARVEALERHSHPPIDLTPAIDEILTARGYVLRAPDPVTATTTDLDRYARAIVAHRGRYRYAFTEERAVQIVFDVLVDFQRALKDPEGFPTHNAIPRPNRGTPAAEPDHG